MQQKRMPRSPSAALELTRNEPSPSLGRRGRLREALRPTIAAASILATLLCAAGCGGQGREEAGTPGAPAGVARLRVHAVNYPLSYFAERIGGDRVEVGFPAPQGEDPAFWSPDASVVAAYQAADLILLNGAGYAAWVDRVSLPPSKMVDTSAAFRDRYVEVDDAVTHSHGPEGEHSHGTIAFTTWLDPTLAVEQARAILDAFSSARPDHADDFERGFESLERDLLEIDRELRDLFSRQADRPLVASHPVYQYLARRYGLELKSVHFEPDEVPDEKGWRDLEALLSDHPARWMLWEGSPLEQTRRRLEALGLGAVVFDPCGNTPQDGDYLDVMRRNAGNLESAFSAGA